MDTSGPSESHFAISIEDLRSTSRSSNWGKASCSRMHRCKFFALIRVDHFQTTAVLHCFHEVKVMYQARLELTTSVSQANAQTTGLPLLLIQLPSWEKNRAAAVRKYPSFTFNLRPRPSQRRSLCFWAHMHSNDRISDYVSVTVKGVSTDAN